VLRVEEERPEQPDRKGLLQSSKTPAASNPATHADDGSTAAHHPEKGGPGLSANALPPANAGKQQEASEYLELVRHLINEAAKEAEADKETGKPKTAAASRPPVAQSRAASEGNGTMSASNQGGKLIGCAGWQLRAAAEAVSGSGTARVKVWLLCLHAISGSVVMLRLCSRLGSHITKRA
jgi:hypothetical protein